ncbi:MAG: ABC transporter ATP-binding protein [Bacilli bacterium]|nr:ABC transporter ATP-binding protein [Bacilli bacterium]
MIKVENLTLTYPKTRREAPRTALRNINVTFEDNSFNVIVGASGSGKTSLLHAVAGLLKYEGDVYFNDRNAREIDIVDRNMALVNQSYVLYPHMTIFDNIAFPLKSKGASKKEVMDAVNEVAEILELDYLLTRKPKELSGGQQQRVALARALIKHPDIYLFDEPLSNVSEEMRDKEKEMIRKAVRKYQSMAIYITHNMREATSLADKIIVLNEGEIVFVGTPDEAIKSDNKVIKELMEASYVL